MTFKLRLKRVKKILRRSLHYFTQIQLRDGGLVTKLVLETQKGDKMEHVGNTMLETLEAAEEYISHEQEVGNLPKEEYAKSNK